MAYRFDEYDQSLVIDGFQNGIAENPYDGIADSRNVIVYSIPGEASVGFSTGSLSATISSGTVTSLFTGTTVNFTGATGIELGMAITFGTTGGFGGISAGTKVYWVGNLSGTPSSRMSLYSDYAMGSLVTVTGSGTATFSVHNVDFSNYQGFTATRFARSTQTGHEFMLDSVGKVWTNNALTSPSGYWRYIGNVPHSASFIGDTSNGNGIVYYQQSFTGAQPAGYFFVFSDSSIDYFQESGSTINISYGWKPSTGTLNNASGYLNSGNDSGNSHDALVAQDNVVYFCDGRYLGSFFQKTAGTPFDPTNTATYTTSSQALSLPSIDTAQCLAELGTDLLVGGTRNLVYPWDRVSTSFRYPILLSETVVQKMVTVNTNTYIFVGNRGRIHVTNGSQAQPWVKIPDHLSGTIEPYFIWGDAVYNKNQLYFGVAGTNNDGTANSNYGAVWAVDLISKALRVINQLSYGSYAGLPVALFARTPLFSGGTGLVGNPSGAGLHIGWCQGAVSTSDLGLTYSVSTSGIDATLSTPYTGGQSYLDSELIPIGTFDQPKNFKRIEYLLTKPLVSGESITIQYRTSFADSFTDIFTDNVAGTQSDSYPINFGNFQWVQFRMVLTSTASNPSYVRLKHIRLTV